MDNVGSSTFAFLIGAVLVAGYLWQRSRWDKRSTEELQAMAGGTDWRDWENGMMELKRRGIDIHPYVAHLAPYLLSESVFEREGARKALADLFPDWQEHLGASGYMSAHPPAQSRPQLDPVFRHFGLALP